MIQQQKTQSEGHKTSSGTYRMVWYSLLLMKSTITNANAPQWTRIEQRNNWATKKGKYSINRFRRQSLKFVYNYYMMECIAKNVRFLDKESSSQKKLHFCQKTKMQSRTVIVLDLVAKKLKLFVISVKLLDAVLSFFLWLCIISAEGVGTKTNEWR